MAAPTDNFSTWLRSNMKKNHIPGLSIALIKDYKIEWVKGFGLADVQNSKPVRPSVLFQAGSISKPVTAMAVLKAVENGKLSLDGDANTFLKFWKIPASPYTKNAKVTLRKLLSHSAGINVSGFIGYPQGEKIPMLVEVLNGQFPANSEPIRVAHPVGKNFLYSGGGYTIVQQILIDAYHQSFAKTLNQLVLEPLNMTASLFQQPLANDLKNNIALPYRPNGKPLAGGPHTYVELAAAGLWTTPTDLAKFVISIQKSLRNDSNQVLSKKSAELLAVIPQSRSTGKNKSEDICDGLGFMVSLNKYGKTAKNGSYFGHAGQNEGYRNFLFANSKNGNGIIIMTNMSPPVDEPDNGWNFIFEILKKIADIEQWS
jgi:CubicO group peptidase (beta-lactamase class C family)